MHSIETAPSGRAKCRGCGEKIAKGELRLGARLPNPFDAETELTLWFHLFCGAYTRPQPLLEALGTAPDTVPDRAQLEAIAKRSLEYERLPRLNGGERAPTGRARCRQCREAIPKDAWRLVLVYYDEEEGRFSPGGFLHPKCAAEYFGTNDVIQQVMHFTPSLEAEDVAELRTELGLPPH